MLSQHTRACLARCICRHRNCRVLPHWQPAAAAGACHLFHPGGGAPPRHFGSAARRQPAAERAWRRLCRCAGGLKGARQRLFGWPFRGWGPTLHVWPSRSPARASNQTVSLLTAASSALLSLCSSSRRAGHPGACAGHQPAAVECQPRPGVLCWHAGSTPSGHGRRGSMYGMRRRMSSSRPGSAGRARGQSALVSAAAWRRLRAPAWRLVPGAGAAGRHHEPGRHQDQLRWENCTGASSEAGTAGGKVRAAGVASLCVQPLLRSPWCFVSPAGTGSTTPTLAPCSSPSVARSGAGTGVHRGGGGGGGGGCSGLPHPRRRP